MRPAYRLPEAFHSYRKLGGHLSLSVFDEFDGSNVLQHEAINLAIHEACGGKKPIDLGRIARLPCQEVSREDFVSCSTSDPLGWRYEEAFGRFGLALVLSNPRVQSGSKEARKLFDDMIEALAPHGRERRFCDWKSWDLPLISPHFVSDYLGHMEWWNTYLLTAHAPDEQRLFVVVGSFDYEGHEVSPLSTLAGQSNGRF